MKLSELDNQFQNAE